MIYKPENLGDVPMDEADFSTKEEEAPTSFLTQMEVDRTNQNEPDMYPKHEEEELKSFYEEIDKRLEDKK